MVEMFQTPELAKEFKWQIPAEHVQHLMIDHSTRNGKYVKDQLARLIWEKHGLPMFRGTIVDEVPFTLRIDRTMFDYSKFGIVVVYRFLSTV